MFANCALMHPTPLPPFDPYPSSLGFEQPNVIQRNHQVFQSDSVQPAPDYGACGEVRAVAPCTTMHPIFTHRNAQQTPPARTCEPLVPLNAMSIRLSGAYTPVSTDLNATGRGFVNFDNPTTLDSARALRMVFDRPNYTGQVNIGMRGPSEIYTPMYDRLGRGYSTYTDINAGDIRYYIDATEKDAYSTPNYTTPAAVRSSVYVDPMENAKPVYDRAPLTDYMWRPLKSTPQSTIYDACDSFTHDQLEFRQDIMARQQEKMNQRNWVYRWGNEVLRRGGYEGV